MVERSGTGWNTESGEMPDGNTAALDREMDRIRDDEMKRMELLARYPLADFEPEAWLHFYDPSYEAMFELIVAHPDAAGFAFCKFAGLSQGYYTSNDMQINRDVADIKNWITLWIEDEMERLQAEKIENEI